jgi:hypothetical protein
MQQPPQRRTSTLGDQERWHRRAVRPPAARWRPCRGTCRPPSWVFAAAKWRFPASFTLSSLCETPWSSDKPIHHQRHKNTRFIVGQRRPSAASGGGMWRNEGTQRMDYDEHAYTKRRMGNTGSSVFPTGDREWEREREREWERVAKGQSLGHGVEGLAHCVVGAPHLLVHHADLP